MKSLKKMKSKKVAASTKKMKPTSINDDGDDYNQNNARGKKINQKIMDLNNKEKEKVLSPTTTTTPE